MHLFNRSSLIIFCMLILLPSANAESLQCVGMDGSGQTIHLILDIPSGTVNINGDILKVISGSYNGSRLTTEKYISDEGVLVQGIVEHFSNKPGEAEFVQINSVTKKIIAIATLACHSDDIKTTNNYSSGEQTQHRDILDYQTEITMNDRYNSNRVRLNSVRDILRQNRANYSLYSSNDEHKDYFSDINNRNIFNTAEIRINSRLENILTDSNQKVYITVLVINPNLIEIYEDQ